MPRLQRQASLLNNTEGGKAMHPNIGLSEEQREGVVTILNTLLAHYHWNVVGPQFNDLHKFFEAQYNELNEIVDDVAERARSLGGHALGTMMEFLKYTRLKEQSGHYPDARTMIADLLADHEALICHLRVDLETCVERYQDAGTNDFLTGLMEQHEKMAWMLRAFLEGK